jgi:hypothetical protein
LKSGSGVVSTILSAMLEKRGLRLQRRVRTS